MKKYCYLLALIIFAQSAVVAQDIHNSQYWNTPLLLNPAAAGSFRGDHRAIINYKDQWRAIDVKYQTMAAAFDMKFLRNDNGSYMGGGIAIFNDKSGSSTLSHSFASMSLSYCLPIDDNNLFSAGIQAGFGQRAIDQTGLTWDRQYNGKSFDPNLPNGEQFAVSRSFADFGGGLQWNGKFDEKYISAGVAAFHLNSPEQSLLQDGSDKLNAKYVANVKADLPVENTNVSILPSGIFMMQGGHTEIIAGTLIRYQLEDPSKHTDLNKGSAFGIGAHYRMMDALVTTVFYEYNNLHFGVSYDIQTSQLSTASNGRGGVEFCIRFINPGSFASKGGSTPMFR